MKKLLTLLLAAATMFAAYAFDTSIAYQGVLRDDQGNKLDGTQYTIEFRLYKQATGGSAIWGRSISVLLDSEGLFNVELADGNGSEITPAQFSSLVDALKDARAGSLFVGLKVDGSSGEISPRQKILSIPYSSYADDVSKASGAFSVAGKATFSGGVEANELEVQGDADFNGAATFEQNATFKGTVAVQGSGKFEGYGTIPVGGIIMWSGSTIPEGWVLCNGENGTPNLVDRFIMGAAPNNSAYLKSGGNSSVTLSVDNLPPHAHMYSGDDQLVFIKDGNYDTSANLVSTPGGYDATSSSSGNGRIYRTSSTGSGSSFSILPPYYRLAFIMRQR